MTEYETATLAFQATQIEISRAGLWVAIAQVGVGLLQAALIAGGLWLMHKTTTARENQHQARHEETMTALTQQGQALHALGEALGQQNEALRQQNESMKQQGQALHALIERTAPRS